MSSRLVALVPMRHYSERVPKKNYRLFAGRPLYHHIVETLSAIPLIDEIVIDTDSKTIMDDVSRNFPKVRLLIRPKHLRADTVPMNNILLHDVQKAKAEYYLQTHSTNPLLRPETITRAIQVFIDGYPAYDSLFSVTRIQIRLWDSLTRAVNHNPGILLRTQDLPPIYQENSCLYLFTQATLEGRRNRVGDRPLMFEIDRLEAWDIDDELDFRIAEFLYREREGGSEEYQRALESAGYGSIHANGHRSISAPVSHQGHRADLAAGE